MTEEIRLLHILSLQQMFRQNCHSHVVQKCHIRCVQLEGNGVGILHGDVLHILIVRRILRTVRRIHDGFNGKFHIICGKFLAVMPFHTLLQMKGVGAGILIKGPVLRQGRNHLVIPIMSRQTIKDQNVDFSVLVHGRVNAGIIAAAVNQRSAILPGCCTGQISSASFRLSCCAALLLTVFLSVLHGFIVCFRRTTGCQDGHCTSHQ